ncbi:MAG: LamG-like jellyroll fold domain-containing protein [Luteolibacter sp.]
MMRSRPRRFSRSLFLTSILATAAPVGAHPFSTSSTVGYSSSQPSGGTAAVSNWTGATFDADNIGGSGVNSNGGANNGTTNDASTCVANNQPRQGQTFITGSNANGYDLRAVTARMAGYANNTASGANNSNWDLNLQNGPLVVEIGRLAANGTDVTTLSQQHFTLGGTGTPGSGNSANGPGTYLTFNLPFSVHLDPNTTYEFDFAIGNGSSNYFEWLGTRTDPHTSGTAFTRAWWGGPITPLAGDRVFMADMTASAVPYAPFVHPGALHTQADLDRMKAKVAAGAQPWKADYDILAASPWSQTWWPPYDVDYIVRGATGNNYTRSQTDAQAIYEEALMWKITGNTAYADHAVQIANVWSGLLGINGDTNKSLAAGICGYLFASGGEILSTYPGWPVAEKQAYKDMMMRVFYPMNLDLLWRQNDTGWRTGGYTHYRLNWDTANMASMAAIGILCDNKAVYQQALDFFKYGPNNGRIERAAWYVHPGGLGQGEEAGRDQGHNTGGWYAMSLLCQMAWNQGDDLFGYDNNRVLRVFEYNARYNLGNDVPYVRHQTCDLGYSEGSVSGATRGLGQYYQYELVYNHYANVKGISAPWSKLAVDATRPEPRPDTAIHPSQVDWLGLGSLTFSRDPITTDQAPTGLHANWSKNQVVLDWWGSSRATGYQVRRATAVGGPFAQIGTVGGPDLNLTDPNVSSGTTYFYIVTAVTPTGNLDSAALKVDHSLVTRYTFEGNADDSAGTRNATLQGGTAAPGFAAGFGGGQALNLSGANQYARLPVGSGNYQDITVATWVYWTGGAAWQRVFDFGTEIEKTMYLTASNGSGVQFGITTTHGGNVEGDASYYLRGPTLPTNQWVHLAVTLNGDTGTLYVNGKPVETKVIDLVDPLFGQPFCYIGRSMFNSDPYFKGRIDDFRIYNYGLTGNEVYDLANQSANHAPVFSADPLTLSAATEDANYGAAAQTLVGSATDVDGGTLVFSKLNGPAWLAIAGNGALSGAPSNADVGVNVFQIRVTDSTGATDDATLRITVANINDAPVWSGNPLVKPAVTRDQPYLAASLAADATDVDAGATLAFSKLGGPAWLSIAADGSLSGTPAVGDVGASSFTVRVTDDTGATSDTTLEITVLGYQLRSHHAFEDSTADSLENFPGAANGSPAYATGRIGRGIVLDGADDYVSLPAAAADYQDVSITAWVFWNGGGQSQRVFDFGNGTTQNLYLSPNAGGNLRFEIVNGGSGQQLNTTPLATGQWVHLAVTLGGSAARLYVNGALAATNNAVSIHPGDFKPKFNYIGKSQWPDPFFSGMIDGFRTYNYALTAAEVAVLLDEVPAVPIAVSATPRTSAVDLKWNASQGAQTYNVKRGLASGGPYTLVASGLNGTAFSNIGLTNGVPCYYVISAANAKGESSDSAQVTAVPSDLLAWWKFNETSGTIAADSSGNGRNGTLTNGPVWTTGLFDGAVSIPAVNNESVTLPSGIVSGLGDFTISGWVKVNAFSTFSRIFDFGSGTTNYMYLTPQYTATAPNSAKLRFAIRTPSVTEDPSGAALNRIDSTIAITAGVWTHVAVTLAGTTGRIYVNGTLAGTTTTMTLKPSDLGNTTLNWFGDSQFGADPTFNGLLDDFRILSRALSEAEINAAAHPSPEVPTGLASGTGDTKLPLHWNVANSASSYTLKRATVSGGPYDVIAGGLTSTSYTDTGLTNDTTYYYVVSASNTFGGESSTSGELAATPSYLRVWLKFDESEGTLAADSSGLGWNATTVNGPAWEAGKQANALAFTGTSSQYATLPTGVIDGLTNATFMAWIKLNGAPTTWQRVFDFGTGTTNYLFLTTQFGTGGNANKLRFGIRTAAVAEQSINSTTVTPTGTWAHVAIVLSGGTGRIYLNGNLVGENTAMTLTPSSLGSTTQNYLGKSQWADPYFNGSIDDFRIYSRALSASEITERIQPPSAPSELTAEILSDDSIGLSWVAAPGATGYKVKRSTTSDGIYLLVSEVNAVSFADNGLANATTYFYVVSAVNAIGESAATDPVSATPLSGYQQWKLGSGLALATAATSAPDGDGISVLMKYATGLTPGIPAADPVVLTGAGQDLAIRFNRLNPAAVDYIVETSPDCVLWSPIATLAAGGSEWTGVASVSESGSGGLRAATATAPASPSNRRFLRLRVVANTP